MNYFENIIKDLPDLITAEQLVKAGIFGSEGTLCKMRKKGCSPDYIQLNPRRVIYTKEAIIKFLKSKMKDGSKPK